MTEQHNADLAASAGFAAALIQLDDRDAIFEWTPCRPECGPCSCSGVPGFTTEMRSLLADHDARVRAAGWNEARSELRQQLDRLKAEWQAQAWDEGWAQGQRDDDPRSLGYADNPYRIPPERG